MVQLGPSRMDKGTIETADETVDAAADVPRLRDPSEMCMEEEEMEKLYWR